MVVWQFGQVVHISASGGAAAAPPPLSRGALLPAAPPAPGAAANPPAPPAVGGAPAAAAGAPAAGGWVGCGTGGYVFASQSAYKPGHIYIYISMLGHLMLRLQLMLLLLVCKLILHLGIWLNHLLLLLLVASLRWHYLLVLHLLMMQHLLLMDMSTSRGRWIHSSGLPGSWLLHVLLLQLLLGGHRSRRHLLLLLGHGINWRHLLILLLHLLLLLIGILSARNSNGSHCRRTLLSCLGSSCNRLRHIIPFQAGMTNPRRASKGIRSQEGLIHILQPRTTLEGILIAYRAATA